MEISWTSNYSSHAQMMHKTPHMEAAGGGAILNITSALFLCSPAASWISGQILTVSGGGVQELD